MRVTKLPWKAKNPFLFLLLWAMLPAQPARAQADITGEWSPRVYNDGMDVGDYTGIPINQAGRLRAEAWHPDTPDLPENLCRPHPIDMGLRVSVSQLLITKEMDPDTGQQVGYRLHVAWQEPEQIIYTDGRPHPSPNAAYKWSGFSTGHWEGNTLVYTTDHLKEAYLTRTGVPRSSKSYGDHPHQALRQLLEHNFHHQRPRLSDGALHSRIQLGLHTGPKVIPPFPLRNYSRRHNCPGGQGTELPARQE